MRLTDIQVALLTDVIGDLEGWRVRDAQGGEFGPYITCMEIEALASEVQEARQRRCANCAHYGSDGDGTWGECERLAPNSAKAFIVTPDWFCADFTSGAGS